MIPFAKEPSLTPSAGEDPQDGTRWRLHLGRLLPAAQVAASLALGVAIWHLLVVTFSVVNPLLLPAPMEVASKVGEMAVETVAGRELRHDFIVTLREIALGFGASVALGIGLGAAISEFTLIKRLAMPYIVLFNSTPRIVFAPMFLVWFGFGETSKVVMAVALATFPVMIGTITGLASADEDMLRLMQVSGATRFQTFRKVRLYASLPYIFAGIETAAVLTVIGVVIGEFAGGSAGLGHVVVVSQETLNLSLAFGAITYLSIMGYALYRLTVWVGSRAVYWTGSQARGSRSETMKSGG